MAGKEQGFIAFLFLGGSGPVPYDDKDNEVGNDNGVVEGG
jgi:hypothetical protein